MTGKPEPRAQQIPMDRAILWNPAQHAGRTSGRAPYPIFFQQEAVVALQDHLKASPDQAIFGFLAGELYRDPEVGVLFAIIDKTLRLNQPIYGDKTEVVVARLWDRMQQRLAQAHGRLLGWYHSHPGQSLTLSPHDVETHQKYFTDPWQVAVLVAAGEGEGGGAVGAFFRAGGAGGVDWPSTPLPFYELLQPASLGSDGKKRSFIMWKNYRAFNAPVPKREAPAPPPLPPRPPPPPTPQPSPVDDLPIIKSAADDEPAPVSASRRPSAPVFVPDRTATPQAPPPPAPPALPAPPVERAPRAQAPEPFPPKPPSAAPVPAPPPPPSPPPSPRSGRAAAAPRRSGPSFRLLDERAPRRSRRGRWLTLLAILLLLGGGGAAGYWYYFLREPGTPLPFGLDRYFPSRGAAPVAPAAPAPLRRRSADTTFARIDRLADTLAVAARNYHDRASLFASGQLDCAGLARGLVAMEALWMAYNAERRLRAAGFDARRAARDQTLYQGVDSVERQFERTRCPRP